MRVLVVEDEPDLARAIAQALAESGFVVDVAFDGSSGLAKAKEQDFDAIVLDLMLPNIDGSRLLRALRTSKDTPVLVLTARNSQEDKISILNLGADDYVTKPFDIDEVIARVQALIRRSTNQTLALIRIGDIEVDASSRTVLKGGERVEITGKEFSLLHLLLINRGKLVTRSAIYDRVFEDRDDSHANLLDVYISNLRKKLGANLIETRRGEGYIVRV